ncbi:chromosomal replication initiator protein DnaA [Ruminococcaceae bacterium KH2T8]|nr:chromosomal replication initiator protein DnaA [Ruminococcaceae bacterium KH2T8]
MAGDLWSDALKILSLDSRIDKLFYDRILSKMKQVNYDDNNNILILSCRDDYSMSLVKGKDLGSYIENAVNMVSDDRISVKYIIEGDENAAIASAVGERAAARRTFEENTGNNTALTSEYTFENFIVGDCNRFAHASAVSVANNPGSRQRNPLYLWGNSGLGKTHLMKAIGYSIIQNHTGKNVLYTTCEEFTNAYVACMNNKKFDSFRNKYRNVDVLLIDDIQFLIGKEGTQLEFFNTFEALITAGKQIVITSDKAPKNLTELDSRLTSRFQNGMTMDIQPPDFETRKAIILNKLEHDNIDISDEIVNYICENVTKNVRELNGAYNIVSAYYALENGNLTLESVQSRLASIISPNKKKMLTTDIVIDAVSKYYDITPDKMISKLRNAEVVNARSVAMYICRDLLEMQYEKIGNSFGGRKHTTVMNACSNVESDENLMQDVVNIKNRITDL